MPFLEKLRDDRNHNIVYGVILAIVPAVVSLFVTYLATNELVYASAGIVTLFVLIVVAVIFAYPAQPRSNDTITFCGLLDGTFEPWERPAEERRVIERLNQDTEGLCLIVGPSGSGKSTLICARIASRLQEEKNWRKPRIFKDYTNVEAFRHKVMSQLGSEFDVVAERFEKPDFDPKLIRLGEHKLLIAFDQAETMTRLPAEDIAWLARLIQLLRSIAGVRIMVVMREDFFLRMLFLGPMMLHPDHLIWIRGFDIDAADDKNLLLGKLKSIVSEETAKQVLEELAVPIIESKKGGLARNAEIEVRRIVLPLEIQVIGQMLERRVNSGVSATIDVSKGGRKQLVRDFFDSHLAKSSNSRIATAALCALSVSATHRDTTGVNYIAGACLCRERELLDALSAMELVHVDEGCLQWRHDWLAPAFREYSATIMDAVLRENISSFIDRKELERVSRVAPVDDVHRRCSVFRWVFILALTLMVLRLTAGIAALLVPAWFIVDPHLQFGRKVFSVPVQWLNREPYVIIVPAHISWAWFVYNLHFVFIRIKEGVQHLAWLIAIVGFLSVILTVIWPMTWLITIGLTGIAVGVSFLQLARDSDLASVARKQLARFGMNCSGFSIITVLAGFGFWFLWEPGKNFSPYTAIAATAVWTLFAFYSLIQHATEEPVTRWLGLLDRRG